MKKWQTDKRFVAWLIKKQYARLEGGKIFHYFTGDGIILYMYEAWCAGKEAKRK